MKKKFNQFKLADLLVRKLNEMEVPAYIWHKATTGSAYIRFEDNRIGSIRIADHRNIEKYKYKFNLMRDAGKPHWRKDEGIYRYFAGPKFIDELLETIKKRAEQVKAWEGPSKYQYGIPSFKRTNGFTETETTSVAKESNTFNGSEQSLTMEDDGTDW